MAQTVVPREGNRQAQLRDPVCRLLRPLWDNLERRDGVRVRACVWRVGGSDCRAKPQASPIQRCLLASITRQQNGTNASMQHPVNAISYLDILAAVKEQDRPGPGRRVLLVFFGKPGSPGQVPTHGQHAAQLRFTLAQCQTGEQGESRTLAV